MAGFDQLGLFGTNHMDKLDRKLNKFVSKLDVSIEFSSSLLQQKIDEVVRKISKEVESFDLNARVSSVNNTELLPWYEQKFLAIDVETTGLDAASNRVIELAIVPFNMGDDVKPFCQLFSVGMSLSPEITTITGITDAMLKNKPPIAEHADECLKLMHKADFMVAYNAKFDRPFLESEMARMNKVLPEIPWLDPFIFICELDRYRRGKKLSDAAKRWGVNLENAHRAMADAQAAGELMLKMADKIDCRELDDVLRLQKIWQWQNAHNMAELKRSSSWSSYR